MSRETQEWLNENILIGFEEKRGKAWHWKEGYDNHFEGPVPVTEVQRRLFDFDPVKVETTYTYRDALTREGYINAPTGEYIYVRDTTGEKITATTETHKAHGYQDWLLTNVSNLLDDTIQIGSAGLLKGGAVAWVQVELSETMNAHGVEFRPNLLATTSLDGSIASTYKAVNTIVVCDNTREAALSEDSPAYKIKHTKNSKFNVTVGRKLVGLQLRAQADAFTADVDRMLHTNVTDKQFQKFLDVVNPVPEPITEEKPGRAHTLAQNKRDRLMGMWLSDDRVSIWQNTVWGVVQLMNTYQTHEATFKGGNRVENRMLSVLSGEAFTKDDDTIKALNKVLVS